MHTLERNQIEIQKPVSDELYRYIGLVALAQESESNDEYLYRQIASELAESLDAEMGTHGQPIELQISNNELYDPTGNSMTQSAYAWHKVQEQRARINPKLDWFSTIARIEAEEHVAVASFMQNAINGSCMLVVSAFPEEAYNSFETRSSVAEEGFRPDLQRSFIRLYQKQQDKLCEHIQSVDSSSLAAWNTVFANYNQEDVATTSQLLSRRLIFNDMEPTLLISEIVEAYDRALSDDTGIMYKFGRQSGGTIEANEFVYRYPQIIFDTIRELKELDGTNADLSNDLAQRTLYNSKALLHNLYEKQRRGERAVIDDGNVRGMRFSEGAKAAEQGKTFYGCSGENSATLNQMTTNTSLILESFTIKNNLEVHQCITCPICNRVVDAIRDPKTKSWTCPKSDCKGYNPEVVSRLNKSKLGSADFSDWLVSFFWGDDKGKKQKEMVRRIARDKVQKS